MPATNTAPKRGRGRPTVLDVHAISSITLRLWSERGYANVNWNDISEATGVSTRTLTRHFETKAAIAWIGTVPATEALKSALAKADPSMELNEAIALAVAQSIESSSELTTTGRLWLQSVANEPALVATAARAYEPWVKELAVYLAQRLPHLPKFHHQAMASAIQASSFSVLLSQAEMKGETSPAEAVREVLQHINLLP